MNVFLIFGLLATLGLFVFTRPRWRQIGPSLLDSFVIGLSLFAAGSGLVWIEGLVDSEAVMRIGLSTALSGILGASLWGALFSPRIAGLDFFADAKRLVADPTDTFVITAGLIVSSLVSVILLIAVFSHEHIRTLLLGAFFKGTGTLNQARIIVSSGAEGYFAPGYVKQFRDIIIPLLCMAAILCDGTFRRRGLYYVALLIAIGATFVSGQRLVIIQYILCFGTVFLIDRFSLRPKFAPLPVTLLLMLILFGAVGAMTKMLGRLDVPLSPLSDQQKQQLQQTPAQLDQRGNQLQKGRDLPSEFSKALDSLALSPIVATPIALAHRAVIAVPRENTLTYAFWSSHPHIPGSGWLTDLGGIRPGTQNQLSNELSDVNRASNMGNSPLGLATDVFYNWGWPGVAIVPALYALFFLWLDVALTASRSALTSAAKIFMFFSIPLMYSPFMFVLYGGFVALATLCYAGLRRNGALSFLGIRPQTRQTPP